MTITENYATQSCGGLDTGVYSQTYLRNTQIYNNYAPSGKDLRVRHYAYFYNYTYADADDLADFYGYTLPLDSYGKSVDPGLIKDERLLENLNGADEYSAWYEETLQTYYVEDKTQPRYAGLSVSIGNWNGDLFNVAAKKIYESTLNDQGEVIQKEIGKMYSAPGTERYFTASTIAHNADPVAEIVQTGDTYTTLSSALQAALALYNADPQRVEIKLLKDVSEQCKITDDNAQLTLDFNGHFIHSVAKTTRSLSIKGVDILLTDRSGNGGGFKGVSDNNIDASQLSGAIYINGGKLTVEKIEISDFRINANSGHGAAINGSAGYTDHPTQIYIKEGAVFKNNISTNKWNNSYGGAIYMTSNNSGAVFEMTGGQFIGNQANYGGALSFDFRNTGDLAKIKITGGEFDGNSAANQAGALYYRGGGANDKDEITMYGFTMKNNSAPSYGAIYMPYAGNSTYPLNIGKEGVKTVFDGNTSTTGECAVARIGQQGQEGSYGEINLNNIEFKNNTANTNYIFYLTCKKSDVRNIDFHDNTAKSSHASLTLASGELLLEDSRFYNNQAGSSNAGLVVVGNNQSAGLRTIQNCEIYNNTAVRSCSAGGVNVAYNDALLKNVSVHDNSQNDNTVFNVYADQANGHTITFEDCHVYNNSAKSFGGGISGNLSNANLILKDTIIENNTALGYGGGVYVNGSKGTVTIDSGTKIRSNRSRGNGGGVYIYGKNLNIKGGEITDNIVECTTNYYGGGVYWNDGNYGVELNMSGGKISGNKREGSNILNGGGLAVVTKVYANMATVNLLGGEISDNTATNGGGVWTGAEYSWDSTMASATVNINGTKIINNKALDSGGGVYVSIISEHTTIGSNALITGNEAVNAGGGLYINRARTNATLEKGGKLYGNRARIGNDAYIYWTGHKDTDVQVYLSKASEMFDSSDEYESLGWIDETRGIVNTGVIKLRPLTRSYPYTLKYQKTNKIVAVYNGNEYVSVGKALEAVMQTDSKTGEIIMVDNSEESIDIAGGLNVTLNLNGHTLRGGGTTAVTNRGILTILDEKKNITVNGKTYTPPTDTVGTITGTASIAGGGVLVKSGKVTMKSGKISDCFAGGASTYNGGTDSIYGGGGVAVDGGEFVLGGGKITDNVAYFGAGVMLKSPSSVFTMLSGEISNNQCTKTGTLTDNGRGAGIYCRVGKLNIHGGAIRNNTAYYGGAIYNNTGTVSIIGKSTDNDKKPVIENNTAGHSGGAIYNNGNTLITSNCMIRNNKTTYGMQYDLYKSDAYNQGAGGGIMVYRGSVNIGDGTVMTGNSAVRGGAVYQFQGSVVISGKNTKITQNTALLGGGCAQNPLPGTSTSMILSDNASVYANKSGNSSGNDFYSAWEDTVKTYEEQLGQNVNNTPKLSLIPASEMTVKPYNVWRNDNYKGEQRIGQTLIAGQYVTANVNLGNNVQITADYYETDTTVTYDSDFRTDNLRVNTISDGTQSFDNGGKFNDSSSKELSAEELYERGEAAISTQTYSLYHDVKYNYIVYNGVKYKHDDDILTVLLDEGKAQKTDETYRENNTTYQYILYKDTKYKQSAVTPVLLLTNGEAIESNDTYTIDQILKYVSYNNRLYKRNATVNMETILSNGNAVESTSTYTKDGKQYNFIVYTDKDNNKKNYQRHETIRASNLVTDGYATDSDKTYVINKGENLNYIEYQGKLYERDQIVEWQPGDDSGEYNKLVRSYDTVNYVLSSSLIPTMDYDTYTKTEYNVRLRVKAVLKCKPEEATFNTTGLTNASVISSLDENGDVIQVLSGYWSPTLKKDADFASMTWTGNVSLNVYAMENGRIVKPNFELWFEGNNDNPSAKCTAENVTVSAAPKYNISVLSNPDLCHSGYFDMETMTEIGKTEYETKFAKNPNDPNNVNGVVMGFGVTVMLYNDPSAKGMKGIELPSDNLEFDLSFTGKLYDSGGDIIYNAAGAPITWAYKENNTSYYGRAVGSSQDTVNMNWNDEDDRTKHSYFAYNAAPYNSGSNAESCYDGGGWLITKSTSDKADETKIHVKVSDYKFNIDNNPVRYAGTNANTGQLAPNSVKAFTAGYIQMILPFENLDSEHRANGYYQLYMDAVASNLNVRSVTGQDPQDVDGVSDLDTPEKQLNDIKGMNEYYNYINPDDVRLNGYAVRERKYIDNYTNIAQAIVVSSGEGQGNDLAKANIFCNDKYEEINGRGNNDNGRGETSINSTIYIKGEINFQSEIIDTNDEKSGSHYYLNEPNYNSETYNLLERNYATAVNILQKFDADAFTVVGTDPIIQQNSGEELNRLLGDNFRITGDAGPTWKNDGYQLTILYAAKPDGTNWVKKNKTNNGVTPPEQYDDGGTEDMDKYREENLLYFKSLDDLNRYFENLDTPNYSPKCVAVLYQFRNCTFRSDYELAAYAKAQVTGEFSMVGKTYCTTNDVRAWYTYRPYLKEYYNSDKTSSGKTVAGQTVAANTYQFNWVHAQQNPTAQTTDSTADDYSPAVYGFALPAGEFIHGKDDDTIYSGSDAQTLTDQYDNIDGTEAKSKVRDAFLERYDDHYNKTRYRNGVKVGGTHNGMSKGNSVLLYSLDSEIALNVETKISGSNSVKREFDLDKGERNVQFRVIPTLKPASEAIKTLIVRDGTQGTDVTMTIKIPKGLNYNRSSFFVDYDGVKNSGKKSGYTEGSLNWTVDVDDTNPEYAAIVTIKTYVSDIDKELPHIYYDCTIGDAGNPDRDIATTTSFQSEVEITTTYYETSLMAALAKYDSETIRVVVGSADGISESIEEDLLELNDDVVLTMSYSNKNESTIISKLQMFDVLPHNSDGRGTQFDGGYRLKTMVMEFSTLEDRDSFKNNNGKLLISKGIYDNKKSYTDYYPNYQHTFEEDEFDEIDDYTESELTAGGITKYLLTYDVSGLERIVYDDDTGAPVICAKLPTVSAGGRVNLSVTLDAKADDGTLLKSPTTEQIRTGGNSYYHNFMYNRSTSADKFTPPLLSNTVAAKVIDRTIVGVAWMDQDYDGLYNTEDWVRYNKEIYSHDIAVEYPIENLKATLYQLDEHNVWVKAKDIFGQEIQPVYTKADGSYQFTNIADGQYKVEFGADDSIPYQWKKTKLDSNGNTVDDSEHPMPFEELSVTKTIFKTSRGNKFCYNDDSYTATNYGLAGAVLGSRDNTNHLSEEIIVMPKKSNITEAHYVSPDWNIGLYYTDVTVKKTWENNENVPKDTTIEIQVIGKTNDGIDGEHKVYEGILKMSNNNDILNAEYTVLMDGEVNISSPVPTSFEFVQKDLGNNKYEWTLADKDRLKLRAALKTETIFYTIKEKSIQKIRKIDNGDGTFTDETVDLTNYYYYNTKNEDSTDSVTKKRSVNLINNQILGSVTITKQNGAGEALNGAEFSIYPVHTQNTTDPDTYYGHREGVDENGKYTIGEETEIDRYKTALTKTYCKVIIGDQTVYDMLAGEDYNKMCNQAENIITINGSNGTEVFTIHKETIDGITYYYYLTDNKNNTFSYKMDLGSYSEKVYRHSNGQEYQVKSEITDGVLTRYAIIEVNPANFGTVAIAEFSNLPLFDVETGKKIYYTVRETKLPDGYISLGNFNSLTAMDLYGDGKDNPHDYSFTVVNNKQIQLPVTGDYGMSIGIVFGTILITLGSAAILLIWYRKKHGTVPMILSKLLK